MTFLVYFLSSLPLIGAYVLLGLGITVIYQASRVLNLAHGAMAMAGAYATYQLHRWGAPLIPAVLGGVVLGGLMGLAVEMGMVRRLRQAGPTTQTVGTVGVLSLSVAVASRMFGTLPVPAPRVLPKGAVHLGSGFVPYSGLGIFPIAVVVGGAVFALFQFTDIGLAMRGAAQNRVGAALRGVNPDFTSSLAWAMGGALAALVGILLAAESDLDPFTMSLGVLPAFVGALLGGLDSLPGVCVGSAVIGFVQGMVPILGRLGPMRPLVSGQGTPELVLGVLALVVMATRGAKLAASDVREEGL